MTGSKIYVGEKKIIVCKAVQQMIEQICEIFAPEPQEQYKYLARINCLSNPFLEQENGSEKILPNSLLALPFCDCTTQNLSRNLVVSTKRVRLC